MKWDPEQLNAQLALYRDMTFSAKPTDLIVWPETAIPVLKEHAQGYLAAMAEFAKQRQTALITGAEYQTHDYYMNIGPLFADPLARLVAPLARVV